MKLTLPANICRFRKERAMTQEQLAEALGVTFASVSKWERGVATPELNLIVQMADLFGVSLDSMVGFVVHSGGACALEDGIHELQRQKKYTEAITEAEKALLRYPNDFRIVYRAGELYGVAGMEHKSEKYLNRGIALLERSVALLSQNTDPQISEASVQSEIAQYCIALGKTEEGIGILKKYNVGGVYSALIANALTTQDGPFKGTPGYGPEDAVPFMTEAFACVITNALRTMMAYGNYFSGKGEYRSCRAALVWLIDFLESVKDDKDAACYVDKFIAPCCCECANLSMLLGETDRAESYMRRGYRAAMRFDAAPTCRAENIKFCIGDTKNAVAYDDLGESASGAALRQLSGKDRKEQLLCLWNKIAAEESLAGVQ